MSAIFPLVTWLEKSSSVMLWGEIHGGGLGDGGRSSGWDWIFGPVIQDAETHITVQASAEPLRTGQLGAGRASVSISTQGRLIPENYGRFPLVSWLEKGGASLVLPISQSTGLGDGGLRAWNEWVFGPPPTLEGESHLIVNGLGTLQLGLGSATASIALEGNGDLLAFASAIWDTEYRATGVVLSDNYLSATAPYETYNGVRGKKSHTVGKYYFEFTKKTVPTSDNLSVGLAKSTVDTRTDHFKPGAWFWMAAYLYEGDVQTSWTGTDVARAVNAIAVDLNDGKIWFYSGDTSEWHNSGNPATGANPTYTGVLGTLYPIFNSAYDSSYPSAVTANFGATAFTHSIPSGFVAWNATEPLVGNIAVGVSLSSTLTIPRTLLGLANSLLSFETSGSLTFSESFVFSGGLTVSLETLADLTVSRTLMESSTEISLSLSGTLTEQPEYSIVAVITLSMQGSLEGIHNMIGNTTIGIELGGELIVTCSVIIEVPTPILVAYTGAVVEFEIPAPIILAKANDFDNMRVNATVPAPTLAAYTGGVVKLSIPAPSLAATGTVDGFATVNIEIPAPELVATASTITFMSVDLEVPSPVLSAATGAYVSLEVLAPVLTATAVTEDLIWVEFTVPSPELTAEVMVGGIATVTLSVPAPILESTGIAGATAQVALVLPAVILTSNVKVSPGVGLPATSVVTETTYAINLTTGAVTTLLLGEITKLITAHGRLYGLRAGTLVRLDGDLDGATTIPATVRFASQTFNTNRAKRLSKVYLDTREDDGLTLEVVSDEETTWRYQTPTDNAPAYGTHKMKVGRGIKFHTAGIMLYNRNGGRMDVGRMELIVDVLSRRPRT